ncbi:hypothetical protein EVAR_17607_1 [Eumeta japonica]|uniref:Uncharacterized protein n=1 Tax=Eumeta variegata TaxID=151549 RepID=A0A4C1UCW8_EUMVA|nr:hypothetical protein EVAR_17607_1 [Eumeta japonica]
MKISAAASGARSRCPLAASYPVHSHADKVSLFLSKKYVDHIPARTSRMPAAATLVSRLALSCLVGLLINTYIAHFSNGLPIFTRRIYGNARLEENEYSNHHKVGDHRRPCIKFPKESLVANL